MSNNSQDDKTREKTYRKAMKKKEKQRQEAYERNLKIRKDKAQQTEERQYKNRNTKAVGDRLEEIVKRILERLKKRGEIEDFKSFPQNENIPDFEVNNDIAIECKNWDPDKKTDLNESTQEGKILSRFAKGDWSRKILIITHLTFENEEVEKECKKILEDNEIEIITPFPFITPMDEVKSEAFSKILWSLYQPLVDKEKQTKLT